MRPAASEAEAFLAYLNATAVGGGGRELRFADEPAPDSSGDEENEAAPPVAAAPVWAAVSPLWMAAFVEVLAPMATAATPEWSVMESSWVASEGDEPSAQAPAARATAAAPGGERPGPEPVENSSHVPEPAGSGRLSTGAEAAENLDPAWPRQTSPRAEQDAVDRRSAHVSASRSEPLAAVLEGRRQLRLQSTVQHDISVRNDIEINQLLYTFKTTEGPASARPPRLAGRLFGAAPDHRHESAQQLARSALSATSNGAAADPRLAVWTGRIQPMTPGPSSPSAESASTSFPQVFAAPKPASATAAESAGADPGSGLQSPAASAAGAAVVASAVPGEPAGVAMGARPGRGWSSGRRAPVAIGKVAEPPDDAIKPTAAKPNPAKPTAAKPNPAKTTAPRAVSRSEAPSSPGAPPKEPSRTQERVLPQERAASQEQAALGSFRLSPELAPDAARGAWVAAPPAAGSAAAEPASPFVAPAAVAPSERPPASTQVEPPRPPQPADAPRIASSEIRRAGEATHLRLLIEDDRLGSLALRLSERGGGVEVVLRADSPSAARQLQQGLPGWHELLAQRGLQVEIRGWSPSTGSDSDRNQQRQDQQRHDQQRERPSRQDERERRGRRTTGGESFAIPARA